MNRRQFLKAAIAVPLAAAAAPMVPHFGTLPAIDWGGRAPFTISARYIYGRVTLSREVLVGGLAGGGKTDGFARAIEQEMRGLIDDMDPPRGQKCIWRSLERGRGFAGYLAREAEALAC